LFPTYAKNICSLLSVQNIVRTLRCTKWRFSSCKKRENFAPCCRICSEGWIFVCDHVIRLRLSVQIIKLDFAIPALAHTWRVTRKGRFSEGGQGYGGVRRGRVSWARSKTPRSNSVPSTWHITCKLTRTATSGAVPSELWSFHLWDLYACGSRDKEYDRCR